MPLHAANDTGHMQVLILPALLPVALRSGRPMVTGALPIADPLVGVLAVLIVASTGERLLMRLEHAYA